MVDVKSQIKATKYETTRNLLQSLHIELLCISHSSTTHIVVVV